MDKSKLNTNGKIYKSFEQWKVETFPELIKEEARNTNKADIKSTGMNLANASFENLLRRI